MKAHDMNTESAANDLTQLSSREQLSALMDGALPPDQTRFLLRRLQHDASLAECWERWRITGETMRGLAPAQRLPADFALRVGAALRGEETPATQAIGARRMPAWLRWGGGAAMAASLAVVALIARQPAVDAPAATDSIQLAVAAMPASDAPNPPVPETQDPVEADAATQALVATTVAAAVARPSRARVAAHSREAARTPSVVARDVVADSHFAAVGDAGIAQTDIVTRPWPRAVLPQYASGGLSVGLGGHAQGSVPYNPFRTLAGIGNLPPPANGEAPQDAQAVAPEPQHEPQP